MASEFEAIQSAVQALRRAFAAAGLPMPEAIVVVPGVTEKLARIANSAVPMISDARYGNEPLRIAGVEFRDDA